MKKIIATTITTLAFLGIYAGAHASFIAGWQATSTEAGAISPTRILGNDPWIKAPYFFATSTTASQLPYASTTLLTVNSMYDSSYSTPFYSGYNLFATDGSNSINFNDRNLQDATNAFSIDWAARTLYNSAATPMIEYGTSVKLSQLGDGVLKTTNGDGTVEVAVANTDYQSPISLTTTGSSGAATFDGTTLNIPQYTGGGGSSFGQTWELYGNNGWIAPTTTIGLIVNASSTIGDGTQTGGLTIFGGATTTNNAYFGGVIAVNGIAGSATSTFATGISIGTGYAPYPEYTFNADPNTGLDSTAPDVMNLVNGGINTMTLTSVNRVGIGTTSPYAKLSVAGRGVFDQDIRADYFTSTSTTIASVFPYASTTMLTASGGIITSASSTIGGGSTTTGLTVFGNATTSGSILVSGIATSTVRGPVVIGQAGTIKAGCINIIYATGSGFATSSLYISTAGTLTTEANPCKGDGTGTSTIQLGGYLPN